MKGKEKVLEQLNAALRGELTAIVQYMVQAEMCDNWGYKRLGAFTKKRAIEEMRHAESLIERIIFLDGTPDVSVGLKPQVGANVPAQLEIDLKDELDARAQYNEAARICDSEKDTGSRELFEHLIEDEESHIDFLEAQLQNVADLGIANYLTEQMKKEE